MIFIDLTAELCLCIIKIACVKFYRNQITRR